jgi:two-component system, OmpR family, KDP operon response regulator KdpE
MTNPCVLVIDDEVQIRKLLGITLQSNGYRVVEAATAMEGIRMAAGHSPDVVLLDLGLPDESGHEVLKRLREWYTKPVIVVSVQSSEEDIVSALDTGANDYVVKPFRTGELLARIRAVMKRSSAEQSSALVSFRSLEIDFSSRTVRKNGQILKLTATEYSLLSLFARNEGKALTHHFLLKEVWGTSYQSESQYLRVFVAQLRKKIEDDPNRPTFIVTESGIGYRFVGNA